MLKRRQSSRSGYTLVELVVATASSMLLLAGMGGSIFVASRAFDEGGSQSVTADAAGNVAEDIMAEMQYATRFYERTPRAVTFNIPDRNGDGSEEKFRYAWSGVAGDPLTKEFNGSPASVLVDKVQNLNFTFLTRTVIAPPPVVVRYDVVFEEFIEAKRGVDGMSLAVSKPGGTVAGNLLIAAVATYDDTSSSLSAPAGWNLINMDNEGGGVTFGVWWKIAAASEGSDYTFSWSSNEQAYGWIMRFSGHHPTNPINASAFARGSTRYPPSPAVTSTVANALILRLGGFEKSEINVDAPGLAGHTVITMDSSNTSGNSASGGAGYLVRAVAGNAGTSSFTLKRSKKFRTVTIAIAPAP